MTTSCWPAVQQLTCNHRQSGDTSWGNCLDTLRQPFDGAAVDGVYNILKSRLGNLSGGTVRESDFDDAMRLLPKNDQVNNFNSRQLNRLVHRGAERMKLVAGHMACMPCMDRLEILGKSDVRMSALLKSPPTQTIVVAWQMSLRYARVACSWGACLQHITECSPMLCMVGAHVTCC